VTELHFQVPDNVAVELSRRADKQGMTVPKLLAEMVQKELGSGWPEGFFEKVVGSWQGEPLERPPQLPFEERDKL